MYRALYRKWRPSRFEDVVGQQPIVDALQNQIRAGRVGHAYLFTGTRGTGKTSCAKIFAKAINCPNAAGGDPCGTCPVCQGIDGGSILDVVEIDAASNNGVDNIRDLRDETAYTPSTCRYKVYIIDEVHMLSTGAFNALLKIMEEPPSHVVFILATTEIHKVPATILSRCQRYDFARIQPAEIAARLAYIAGEEGLSLAPEAGELIARLADGALRDALSILDTCAGVSAEVDEPLVRRMAGVTERDYLFSIGDALAGGDAAKALAELAQLHQRSVDLKRLCEELLGHYRSLMLACLPGGEELLSSASPEERLGYLERAKTIRQSDAIRAIRQLGAALERMGRGTDPRIELELAFLAISEPPVPPAAANGPPAGASIQAAPAAPQPFAEVTAAQKNVSSGGQEEAPAVPLWMPASTGRNPSAPPVFAGDKSLETASSAGMVPPQTSPTSAFQVPEPAIPPAQASEGIQDVPKKSDRSAAAESEDGDPVPFASWPEVIQRVEKADASSYSFLKHSRAYLCKNRVLIDGGNAFREFIRKSEQSKKILKEIITQVTGQRYGIGPYEPPAQQKAETHTLEDTIEVLNGQGVDIVYRETE